jgi:hypothetical protein
MPEGDTTNTAAASSTQGSGQTQEASAGATTQAASTSTTTAETQAQPPLLQLTQTQLDELIKGRVSRAVRADRRERAKAPADGKSTPPTETSDATDQDDLRTQLEAIQAQLAQRDAELAQERRTAWVAKAMSRHKLAADLADRVHGATEAEIDADAAKLAKLIGPPVAPRTEAGGGAKPSTPPPSGPPASATAPTTPQYPFQSPGDVAW